MKFSKPISREVDIEGNTFILTFSDLGVEFRLKGKRRTASTDWIAVLNAARGDDGESARELLGVETNATSQRESEPQAIGESDTPRETENEIGRAVTAGEVGPES